MTDALAVGYFLEDIAQGQFVTALVQRVARNLGLEVMHDVRNASGGKGRVLSELRRYLLDMCKGRIAMRLVVVVAIDGNCSPYQDKRREIEDLTTRVGYLGKVVCAVPDPHIECWYLADPDAFRAAVPGSHLQVLSETKRERHYYKQALREAFRSAGVTPQLGGAEYADVIVAHMDLHKAAQHDRALRHFLGDLNSILRMHCSG